MAIIITNAPGSTATGSTTSVSSLIQNVGLVSAVASNAMTITMFQSDASTSLSAGSPAKIAFRSATAGVGGYNIRTITSGPNITVPSGATLGQASGNQSYMWIYALDNSGTVELAVSSIRYDDGTVQNTTAISSSATSIGTIYSTTARTGVPIRLIGRGQYTETTAGTWATNFSEIALPLDIKAGELIACQYNTTGGVTSWTTNQIIPYTSKIFDTHNGYNPSTGLYTCPTAGIYRVINQFYANGSTSFTFTYLGVNGAVTVSRLVQITASAQPATILYKANAGDTLGIYNATGPATSSDGSGFNSISVERIY